MYSLLHNFDWKNGKQYSIFGVPDIGDFSVAFGTWNPYDLALKNVNKVSEIKKAEAIARVEGMKEGALSPPIVYFEKGLRTTEGHFTPKVQTKKITKVFKEKSVKQETKNQTLNALTDKLKTVNEEYKSVMVKPAEIIFNSEIVAFPEELQFKTFDQEKIKELMKEKQSLETRITKVRSIHPKTYKNITNFSQLVKNPNTILTLADQFTIFDSNAYNDTIDAGGNPMERINDIRDSVNRIPSELLDQFKLNELMGPPELLPTKTEAFKRAIKNPIITKPKLTLTHNIELLDIPNNQYTPTKKAN